MQLEIMYIKMILGTKKYKRKMNIGFGVIVLSDREGPGG